MIILSIGGGSTAPPVFERTLLVEGRTRGPLVPLSRPADAGALPFTDLLDALRAQVRYLPLTIIIHGWGGVEAKYFFETLAPNLHPADAIWLVPADGQSDDEEAEALSIAHKASPVHTSFVVGAIRLSGDHPIDSRIYANLVGDLVFFPAAEERECALVARFARRARAVLVSACGAFKESVCRTGAEAGLSLCEWPDEPKADASAQGSPAGESAMPGERSYDELVQKVGAALTEMTEYLRELYGRRHDLRAEINKIISQHPEYPKWDEALIRQAHQHGWESWAVECLLNFYVPLARDADRPATALVWHYVLHAVPQKYNVKILGELCGGAFLLVEPPEEAVPYLKRGASIFEEQLATFPYASERSFRDGALNNALLLIELALRDEDAEAAQKLKQLRQQLLSQDKIIKV